MSDSSKSKVLPCVDAEAFVTELVRFGRRASDWSRRKSNYLFRGQPNAQWKLHPKRFRSYVEREQPIPSIYEQAQREIREIRRFFDTADEHGLQLPEDTQRLRESLIESRPEPKNWPEHEFWSLLGLAQHYGLPTRLLDWTRAPLAAAYFAAAEAAAWLKDPRLRPKSATDAHELAVFVLDLAEYEEIRADTHDETRWLTFPFRLVTSPGWSNPNLVAQNGCFTLYEPRVADVQALLDIQGLDEVYADIVELTLPHEKAGQLLWLLDRYRVSAASLFPGYRGVTQALREEDELYEPIATLTDRSGGGGE